MSAQRGASAGQEEPPPVELRTALIQGLQEQFPGVRVWFGEATGSWWALVPTPAGSRLVEAPTPQALREAIMNARIRG